MKPQNVNSFSVNLSLPSPQELHPPPPRFTLNSEENAPLHLARVHPSTCARGRHYQHFPHAVQSTFPFCVFPLFFYNGYLPCAREISLILKQIIRNISWLHVSQHSISHFPLFQATLAKPVRCCSSQTQRQARYSRRHIFQKNSQCSLPSCLLPLELLARCLLEDCTERAFRWGHTHPQGERCGSTPSHEFHLLPSWHPYSALPDKAEKPHSPYRSSIPSTFLVLEMAPPSSRSPGPAFCHQLLPYPDALDQSVLKASPLRVAQFPLPYSTFHGPHLAPLSVTPFFYPRYDGTLPLNNPYSFFFFPLLGALLLELFTLCLTFSTHTEVLHCGNPVLFCFLSTTEPYTPHNKGWASLGLALAGPSLSGACSRDTSMAVPTPHHTVVPPSHCCSVSSLFRPWLMGPQPEENACFLSVIRSFPWLCFPAKALLLLITVSTSKEMQEGWAEGNSRRQPGPAQPRDPSLHGKCLENAYEWHRPWAQLLESTCTSGEPWSGRYKMPRAAPPRPGYPPMVLPPLSRPLLRTRMTSN